MPGAAAALVQLDGSEGDGGGALVRVALAMAAVTQQGVRVDGVRGGSPFPGLDAEELSLIAALQGPCGAETVGADYGAASFSFLPARRCVGLNGEVTAVRDSRGRGPSAPVLASALAPVLARSGAYSSFLLGGETYGVRTLGFDALAGPVAELWRKMGLYCFPDLRQAGFGRMSSGEIAVDVEPSAIQGVDWTDRGRLLDVRAVVAFHGHAGAAERAAAHLKRLGQNSGVKIEAEVTEVSADEPGMHVTAWARYDRGLGSGSSMAQRGMRPEMVAQGAFDELFAFMSGQGTLDPHLADHALLPAVLAEGPSAFRVTRLTRRFLTLVRTLKAFTPIHLTVRGSEDGPGLVTVQR